jgi:hypothetical protein
VTYQAYIVNLAELGQQIIANISLSVGRFLLIQIRHSGMMNKGKANVSQYFVFTFPIFEEDR